MAKKQEKMITIAESEYNQLCRDSQWLAALEAAGVDNWDGYEEAYDILEEWQKENEDEE